ncbi:hypothetical protein [Oceanospirillum sediminis]|uniref:Uncharacterized protein n=1 Tax=Oceanospirillum sediminis TaxID=2760088 RepID=A0A839IQA6_9GAMM|nr:hypothetical protein [Oceanospirillum sediminis]MBB1487435.1 hypothetical protein [Oceanospirillum sediminis]
MGRPYGNTVLSADSVNLAVFIIWISDVVIVEEDKWWNNKFSDKVALYCLIS